MTGGALRRRWARGLPPRRKLAIVALAGLAAASGQAPLGWWWLALPGYGLLVARVAHAETAANAFWLAWIGAAAHFAAALFWIVEPFLIEPERYAWMAPFALVFMAFGLALFWAAPAVLAARLGQGASARALLFALAMPLAEWLRGWLFTGFPWAEPGQVWVGTPVLQLAALAGPRR
ncbi:MAG: hypothetical protein R3D84_04495 [Paracoccaceae bacterium]